ncbi:hypothetical protein T10_5669 [Trichinella papuae]|uniref:Uncharacterized protein n=1 Tax=Trichinella papuae TaxID=268474 RepID=A0A0V1MKF2_9BILA|nr:hypothetical protein T10_5669 [Trichinella papuae]
MQLIKLNQTYINITSCERNRFHKFCIGLIILLAVLWLITIIIFCVWRFKPMNMVRLYFPQSIRRRAEEEKIENNQNFCISAAAEQMVSVEESFIN